MVPVMLGGIAIAKPVGTLVELLGGKVMEDMALMSYPIEPSVARVGMLASGWRSLTSTDGCE